MGKSELIVVSAKSETIITQGEKGLIFKKISKGKRVSSKKVPEITEQKIKDYKLIGTAEGCDLFHCVYLAHKYTEHFDERVVAYIFVKPKNKKYSCVVAFYEKKKVLNRS